VTAPEAPRWGTYVRESLSDPNRLEVVRYWSGPNPGTEAVSCAFRDLAELRQFVRDVQRFAKGYERRATS
jgi:hypothetical protein